VAKKNSKKLNSKFGDFFQKKGYCDRIFPSILFLQFWQDFAPKKDADPGSRPQKQCTI
jgi:hypothetical protein